MRICTVGLCVCMYLYRKPLHSFINLPCYIFHYPICCDLPCRFLHAINLRVICAQSPSPVFSLINERWVWRHRVATQNTTRARSLETFTVNSCKLNQQLIFCHHFLRTINKNKQLISIIAVVITTHTHTHTHTHIYIYIHTHIYIYTHTYIYTPTLTHTYIYIYI